MAEWWGGGAVACGPWAAGDALLGWAARPPPRRCPWMPRSRMGGSLGRGLCRSPAVLWPSGGDSPDGTIRGSVSPEPFHCPPASGVLPGFRWAQLPEPCLPIPSWPLPCAVGRALWSSASPPPRCGDPSRAREDELRPSSLPPVSLSQLPPACGEPGVPLPITRKPTEARRCTLASPGHSQVGRGLGAAPPAPPPLAALSFAPPRALLPGRPCPPPNPVCSRQSVGAQEQLSAESCPRCSLPLYVPPILRAATFSRKVSLVVSSFGAQPHELRL